MWLSLIHDGETIIENKSQILKSRAHGTHMHSQTNCREAMYQKKQILNIKLNISCICDPEKNVCI